MKGVRYCLRIYSVEIMAWIKVGSQGTMREKWNSTCDSENSPYHRSGRTKGFREKHNNLTCNGTRAVMESLGILYMIKAHWEM